MLFCYKKAFLFEEKGSYILKVLNYLIKVNSDFEFLNVLSEVQTSNKTRKHLKINLIQ